MTTYLTPSIKALDGLTADRELSKVLKQLLTASRAELEATPAGEERIRECWTPPKTSDLRLTCLNAALGAYGVEAFQTRKGELVEYLNMGDTYAPTIVRFRGNYRIACWGDFAEKHC